MKKAIICNLSKVESRSLSNSRFIIFFTFLFFVTVSASCLLQSNLFAAQFDIVDEIQVSYGVYDLKFSPDYQYLYAAHHRNGPYISKIRISDYTVVSEIYIDVNSARPADLEFSLDGRYLYVTTYYGRTVTVIDTATDTVIKNITGFSHYPYGLELSPSGTELYVTNGRYVHIVNTTTNEIEEAIMVGNTNTEYPMITTNSWIL